MFFLLAIVNNRILELRIIIPKTFYNAGRMLAGNADNKKFTKDNHKATGLFALKCNEVEKELSVTVKVDHDTGEEEIEVSASVQQIGLRFEVEEDLYRGKKGRGEGYKVLGFENEDDVLFAEMEETTDLFILSVNMVSNKKKKKKKKQARGSMHKVKSPMKNYSDSSESSEDKGYDEDAAMGGEEQ